MKTHSIQSSQHSAITQVQKFLINIHSEIPSPVVSPLARNNNNLQSFGSTKTINDWFRIQLYMATNSNKEYFCDRIEAGNEQTSPQNQETLCLSFPSNILDSKFDSTM